MKRYILKFGIIGALIFLGLFIHFYRSSRDFKKSVLAAFASMTVYLSSFNPLPAQANDFWKSPPTTAAASASFGLPTGREAFTKRQAAANNNNEKNKSTKVKVEEQLGTKAIKNIAKTALNNEKVKTELNNYKKWLAEGKLPSSTTKVDNGHVLVKGTHGRYLIKKDDNNNKVQILGIADRSNEKNVLAFAKAMNNEYNAKLKYKGI